MPHGCPMVRIRNYEDTDKYLVDTLHNKAVQKTDCQNDYCCGSIMNPNYLSVSQKTRCKSQILKEANEFITEYFSELNKADSPAHEKRWEEVRDSIEATNTYDLTYDELEFGTKLAWRNAPRCVGRAYWKRLEVFDARHVTSAQEMFEALCKQMEYATNGGKIRSAITVFPKRVKDHGDFRVWNSQLVQYAGHTMEDGSVVGDPVNVEFTHICEKLGYVFQKTPFEVLPWVLQANGEDPKVFEIPKELIHEVPISHPKYDIFEKLGLRWYAVPAVSNMAFDCGGLEFPGAPFNGWYMTTEIAVRDFCDKQRLNLLDQLAEGMGFDIKSAPALWKDQALGLVSFAVLNSFKEHRTTIVDHFTVTEQFMEHYENEIKVRGGCPADWVWLVPPISGSLCPVFHQEMISYKLKPCFDYQNPAWKCPVYRRRQTAQLRNGRKFTLKSVARCVMQWLTIYRAMYEARVKCTIIYATETGTSAKLAAKLSQVFVKVFNVKTIAADDYRVSNISDESLVFIVASTFGDGEPPGNGESFFESLKDFANEREAIIKEEGLVLDENRNVSKPFSFGVFALGSSNYPHFCAFGHTLDALMPLVGGERIVDCGEGDEVNGQEQSFNLWTNKAFREAVNIFYPSLSEEMAVNSDFASADKWIQDESRAEKSAKKEVSILKGISHISSSPVHGATLSFRSQLQSTKSRRKTMLISVDRSDFRRDLSFEAGDHLAIFPTNRKEDVQAVINWVNRKDFDSDTVLEMKTYTGSDSAASEKYKWNPNNRLPPCSLRFALTYLLDLRSAPQQHFLADLQQFAKKKREQNDLEKLSKDVDHYEAWKTFNAPNIPFLAKKFPSTRPSIEFILDCLPLIIPRYYSISSSPNAFPKEIQLTVAVENFMSNDGVLHKGMCSSWLNDIPIGEVVPCYIKKAAAFRMPSDPKVPVIMIGPGTGIAPFRSFWQERCHQKESGEVSGESPMVLYFGCRSKNLDHIYEREISSLISQGVLTDFHLALSREKGEQKIYVQDLLRQNQNALYNQLVELKGHLYICGGVNMASDVKTVLNSIFEDERGTQENFTSFLKKERRFHEDIFGASSKKLTADAFMESRKNNPVKSQACQIL